VIEVVETSVFARWFERLRDREARARIAIRIRRMSLGNFGTSRAVGSGVEELKIDWGPGYRVYYVRRGATLVVLLAGGDKRTQRQDIARAIGLARTL
jgi:putative addiction module killer protein